MSLETFNINNMYGTEFLSQEKQYQDDWGMLASSAEHNKRKGNSERSENPIWNKQGERKRTEKQNEKL